MLWSIAERPASMRRSVAPGLFLDLSGRKKAKPNGHEKLANAKSFSLSSVFRP